MNALTAMLNGLQACALSFILAKVSAQASSARSLTSGLPWKYVEWLAVECAHRAEVTR